MQFGSGLDPPFGSQILVPRSVFGGLRGLKISDTSGGFRYLYVWEGVKKWGLFHPFFCCADSDARRNGESDLPSPQR